MSLTAVLPRAARWLADAAFPPRCLGCRAWLGRTPADLVPACPPCREALLDPSDQQCRRCGARVPSGARVRFGCAACRRFDPRVPRALACGPYDGRLGGLVRALKFSARPAVARLLGWLAAERVRRARLTADAVVPVPSSALRRAHRGVDHAGLIAREAARHLGLPCVPRALVRTGRSRPLARLGREARRAALAGAFDATGALVGGRRVLLIDDVLTTGATLAACREALDAAGAARVSGVCVARRR